MNKAICLKISKYYGGILLVYASIEFVIRFLARYSYNLQYPSVDMFHYAAQISGLTVFLSPLNFLIGYGLFRQRKWALYIALTCLIFYPLQPIANWLSWGNKAFSAATVTIQSCAVILTFVFLYIHRHSFLEQEEIIPQKKWKKYVIMMAVLIICLYPLFATVGLRAFWSWKFHSPFLNSKPNMVILSSQPHDTTKFQRIVLFDMSFIVPQGLTDLYFSSLNKDKSGHVFLRGAKADKKWNIIVSNNSILQGVFDDPKYVEYKKKAGISNPYEEMRFILTNNWNPMAYMPGIILNQGENCSVSEFRLNTLKGFIRKWDSNGLKHVTVNIYKDSYPSYREIEFMMDPNSYSDSDINDIVSSIEFLPPPNAQKAGKEAERGQQYQKRNDLLSAQAEFLNAYFHSPDNPEYLLMYLKTLPFNTEKRVKSLRYRLDEFIKNYPKNTEAREMRARFAIQNPISSVTAK
jgi:hypothetical protein